MTEENKGVVLPGGFTSLADTLRQLPPVPPPPPIVKNLWYNNQKIKVDGWTFESCRFDNCTIIVHTPYFTFKNCYFDESSVVHWGGSVLSIIQLFTYQAGINVLPQFSAVRNPDGTVTMGG